MAKSQVVLRGDYASIVNFIGIRLEEQSVSISLEDEVIINAGGKRVCLRVYERYSYTGGNRCSMSVLFMETDDGAQVSAITSGGSRALIFKIRSLQLGEQAFLDTFERACKDWEFRDHPEY